MFDIGFWELLLIAIVSLFVVGPEKFPGFIREAGVWVNKAQRFIQQTRREINQELLLHEQQSFKEKIADLDDLMHNAPDRMLNADEADDDKQPGSDRNKGNE